MRKIILLLLVALLSACSSNDSNGLSITSQNLSGKWYLKGGTTNGGSFQDYDHQCSTSRDYQEFLTNGTLTFNEYNPACEQQIETSNWVLNGYEITVTNTALDPMIYEYKYVIEDLTNQLLILKQTVTEPGGTSINRIYLTRN
jgi:hypothetical protein